MMIIKARDERLAETAVALLAHVIQTLTPLPFFRTAIIGLVKRLISPTESHHDLVSAFIPRSYGRTS